MSSIPKEISREIILVDYNLHNGTHLRDRASESTGDNEQKNYVDDIVQHVKVEGEFACASVANTICNPLGALQH
jgi:hypothetical protein